MKRITTILEHNLAWLVTAGVLLATLFVWASSANAASVTTDTGTMADGRTYHYVFYTAAPGEDNDLVIRDSAGSIEFDDTVAVSALGGCQQVTASAATCGSGAGADLVGFFVNAGNGVNKVVNSSSRGMTITGANGRNDFTGSGYDDTLIGSGHDDVLKGRLGDDKLEGHGGNDDLDPGIGTDVMTGGGGRDVAIYAERTADLVIRLDDQANDGAANEADNVGADIEDVVGGSGDDRLYGSSGNNELYGMAGSDALMGAGGSDVLVSGPGADDVWGENGADKLFAGPGNDTLRGGPLGDELYGDQDDDWLFGEGGPDRMAGGDGVDVVSYDGYTQRVFADLDGEVGDDGLAAEGDSLGTDVEHLIGGAASDVLAGNGSVNVIRGGHGNDVITGFAGGDQLIGDQDDDTIRADDGEADAVDCGEDVDDASAADEVDQLSACEVVPAKPGDPADPAKPGFRLAKVKRNRAKGTAKLAVVVDAPGKVELLGTGKVRGRTVDADAPGTVRLKVQAKGKAAAKLREAGSLRARLRVTYTPEGGAAATASKRVRLVRR